MESIRDYADQEVKCTSKGTGRTPRQAKVRRKRRSWMAWTSSISPDPFIPLWFLCCTDAVYFVFKFYFYG